MTDIRRTAYYNEIEPYAAQWLRNLIAQGLIAPGDVDERDIRDVRPDDLRGYAQCHFFAGIGVWSYALRGAGWADDRPVWTGSCPCQPFSAAGRGAGFADERHLWPAWHHLIRQCRPTVVFGEQVASKDADPWIDLVQSDMEAMGYAFGTDPFPAAGLGAPHIRDRNWWVADAEHCGRERRQPTRARAGATLPHGSADRLALPAGAGPQGRAEPGERVDAQRQAAERASEARGVADSDGGNASAEGLQRGRQYGQQPRDGGAVPGAGSGPLHGFWRDADWLLCRDGKWRPVEPGTFPLAHGAAARVGRLRAYGNAIVAPCAEAFIRAYLGEALDGEASAEAASRLRSAVTAADLL